MKKFLLPLFLMLATAVGFTSCSDDDDDDKTASVAVSVNGSAVENNGTIDLKKGTVLASEGTTGTDDVVTLDITSTDNKNITSIQVSVNNDFESNVAVTDNDGNVLNDKFKYTSPATSKTVKFTGVYGTYTVKVVTESGSKTYKLTTAPVSGHMAYGASSNRYMSNKQTIVFDSNNEKAANSVIGLTYNKKVEAGATQKNFGNAQLYKIDADTYTELQGSKGDFYIKADGFSFGKVSDLNMETYEYLVYKNGSKYYLIHLTSIDDNILKAEIQY